MTAWRRPCAFLMSRGSSAKRARRDTDFDCCHLLWMHHVPVVGYGWIQSALLQTVCDALSRNIIAMNRDSLRQVHQFFVTCDLDSAMRGTSRVAHRRPLAWHATTATLCVHVCVGACVPECILSRVECVCVHGVFVGASLARAHEARSLDLSTAGAQPRPPRPLDSCRI